MFKFFFILLFILFGNVIANQLENETSPYLLQHKDNPVNWYPWSEEVFKKAQKENKLIFLSIGYSTCHWCHVMAEESFEDKEIAQILNKDFISIKVDREQFPHIDRFYQKVYNAMNNKSGGWPLTIIMTPQKEPFFSATYIPKYPGYGSRGLRDILKEFASYDKKKLKKYGKDILAIVNSTKYITSSKAKFDNKTMNTTLKQFENMYDKEYKGFGTHPKFPQFANIILLLKLYQINHNHEALTIAIESLKAMARGGIFDQIEGGFYRYSVNQEWTIPHFEKMLYTNSEALEAYTLAYKITKEPLFKDVIEKTISQIDERFLEDGVYKSASNADSKNRQDENEEGYYFIFDYMESLEYLEENGITEKTAIESLKYLGIKEDGNFDGEYSNPEIIGVKKPEHIQKIIALLKQFRKTKKYPFIDNKINTAWNALYIKGKLIASRINKKYLKSSLNSLDSLLKLIYKDKELYHQTIKGKIATQKALLEDYSFLISTLFEAYQITLDKKYLTIYKKLVKKSIEKFYQDGRWIEADDNFKTYASINDSGYASALGVHFVNLMLYATMEEDYTTFEIIKRSMQYYVEDINKYPSHFPNATLASIFYQFEPVFIKAKKDKLEKFSIEEFNYPFVYKKVYNSDEYLACKLSSCFSYSTDIKKIIKDINKLQK